MKCVMYLKMSAWLGIGTYTMVSCMRLQEKKKAWEKESDIRTVIQIFMDSMDSMDWMAVFHVILTWLMQASKNTCSHHIPAGYLW